MLFEPFEIQNLRIANRVISAPLASASSLEGGAPSPRTLEIYKKIAASGVGLVIAEHHAVSLSGCVRLTQLRSDSDEIAEQHAALTAVFKDAGVPAIAQISHCGGRPGESAVFSMPDYRSLSPSGIVLGDAWKSTDAKNYPMTISEIKKMIEDFVDAAVRLVKISGYDGVQIHGAHGYMLGQFLSPLTNRRTDAYGGTDSRRARLLYEITDAIRQSLPDSIVSFRLGMADTLPGEPARGLSLDETIPVACELANLGVDLLCLSGNHCGYGMNLTENAYFSPYAERFHASLGMSIPTVCTGGIKDAGTAEKLLCGGVADFVGIGRLMQRNPDFLREWKDEL